jgi:hypothetical protein
MKKITIIIMAHLLSGCVPLAQSYIQATAINTSYAMKTSTATTSMLTSKQPKEVSECIGNAFSSYNDDGDYIYGDTKVNQLKGENYEIISKRPWSKKLASPLTDHNIDQILFLTEVKTGSSGKNRVDIWYNPDAVFASDKIELAKTLVAPCI